MNTIEAFERDIMYQVTDLANFLRTLDVKKIDASKQERCVFTGAGDSFAVALLTEMVSDNRARCIDPMDICADPSSIRNRFLYAVSVSGNTKANIAAASVANKVAERTIAVTANAQSKLAGICDDVIELRFRSSGILTAGSIGFTACMLACMSLVREVHVNDVKKIFRWAERDASGIEISDHTYIVGSHITYPLAMYGTAKMYEVFGTKAQYTRLEQFCHMELFSIKKNDSILILADESANGLYAKLADAGYRAVNCKPRGKNLEEKLLYYTMLLQLIALNNAKSRHIKECYFMTNDKLRSVSSSLIY